MSDPMAELSAAVNQFEAARVCGRCVHWHRKAWKALKVVLASTTHGQRRLNEYRHRFLVATKGNLTIANASAGDDDDFEEDHALGLLGVCQAMTMATNDPSITHKSERCPRYVFANGAEDKARPFDQFSPSTGQPVPPPPAFMACMRAAIEEAKKEPAATPQPAKPPPPKNLTEAFEALVREKHNPVELAGQFVEASRTDAGLKGAFELAGGDPMKALFGDRLLPWLVEAPTNPLYANHFAAEVQRVLHPPPPPEDAGVTAEQVK